MASLNRAFNLRVASGQGDGIRVVGATAILNSVDISSQATAIRVEGGRMVAALLEIGSEGNGIELESDGSVIGTSRVQTGLHGIYVTGGGNLIVGVEMPVVGVTSGDGIHLAGNANTVMDCQITGDGTTNSAINAQGDDNVYVPNVARGTFATAPFIDGGTGNVNTFPNAGGAQGDNLVV
jgi:hypothetical protein